MTRVRRHFTAQQKADVVRRHVAGKGAVSSLAEELGVRATSYWCNAYNSRFSPSREASSRT
jgi:transposase-like protein